MSINAELWLKADNETQAEQVVVAVILINQGAAEEKFVSYTIVISSF